jgi:hypothetical protein
VYDTITQGYVYTHEFDNDGQARRSCNPLVGGHPGCHSNVYGGACDTHDTCNNFASTAIEVEKFLTDLRERPAAAEVMRRRLATLANVRVAPERGILQIVGCGGRVVAQWRLPPVLANVQATSRMGTA